MDKLLEFINSLPVLEQQAFAAGCGTSIGYLRKAISKGQLLGAALCVAIEQATAGAVTRKDLRPNDWAEIWPELIDAA